MSFTYGNTGWAAALMAGVPGMLVGLLTYGLTAYALYSMAKSRGIVLAWLAWIPVANLWILGSLSDQYQYVACNEIRSRRKWLLVLNVLTKILGSAMTSAVFGVGFRTLMSILTGSSQDMISSIMTPLLVMIGMVVPLVSLVIAKTVLYYMALYDVYRSCDPDNCVLFLVLSMIFGITKPFFLFANRNKELGMPPRRNAYAAYDEPMQYEM